MDSHLNTLLPFLQAFVGHQRDFNTLLIYNEYWNFQSTVSCNIGVLMVVNIVVLFYRLYKVILGTCEYQKLQLELQAVISSPTAVYSQLIIILSADFTEKHSE